MADESQLEYDEEHVDSQPAQRPAAGQGNGSDLPIKQGAVFGAIAVVATYLAHLLVTLIATAQTAPVAYTDGTGADATLIVTDLVASWKAAGWSYVAALGSGFEAGGERATLGDATNHAAGFTNSPFELSATLLVLVTVGGAVAAGYAVARHTDADDAVEALKASLTVVPAYLVFGAVIAFVTTAAYSEPPLVQEVASSTAGLEVGEFFNEDGNVITDLEFGPSTTDAIVFAGLVVPAVLAAIGGLLTQREDAAARLLAAVEDR